MKTPILHRIANKGMLCGLLLAQGAPLGYYLYTYLHSGQRPFGEHIVETTLQQFDVLAYIWIGTSVFFALFGLLVRQAFRETHSLHVVRDRFLSVAAHDLRNPLSIIIGYVKELKASASAVQKGQAKIIENQAEFALQMVNELLDVGKLQAGELTLDKEEVEIVEFLRNLVEANHTIASKKQIRIEFSSELTKGFVLLDKFKLSQVVNNVISNAIKYSEPDTRVQVSLYDVEDRLCIVCEDQGLGIPSGDLPYLFDPFVTTKNKATRGEKSTGLGLYIVKKIVDLLGGEVEVESEVGKGTLMRISFPKEVLHYHEEPIPKQLEDLPPPPVPLRPKNRTSVKVLIIDDSMDVQGLIRVHLKGASHVDAHYCLSGGEALHALDQKKFDVILMDYHLKDMNGKELFLSMKSKTDLAPVVCMSADLESCKQMVAMGCVGYLLKPFQKQDILDKIEKSSVEKSAA